MLYKHVPSIRNKAIIYDAGCKLLDYGLNREVAYILEADIFIDKLHYKNHTMCSRGFDLKEYMWMDSINSVVCEQKNSTLRPFNRSLSYMLHSHYMTFMKWAISRGNTKVIDDWKEKRRNYRYVSKMDLMNSTISKRMDMTRQSCCSGCALCMHLNELT
jgi:hypothetical protein